MGKKRNISKRNFKKEVLEIGGSNCFSKIPPAPADMKPEEKKIWFNLGEKAVQSCCMREIHLVTFRMLVETIEMQNIMTSKLSESEFGSEFYLEVLTQINTYESIISDMYQFFHLDINSK